MTIDVFLLLAAGAGAFLGWTMGRRRSRRDVGPMLMFIPQGGGRPQLMPAQLKDDGTLDLGGGRSALPEMYQPVDDPAQLAGRQIFFMVADNYAAFSFFKFQALVKRVIQGHLFSPRGDTVRMLQMAAMMAALIVSIYLWFSFGSLVDRISEIKVAVDGLTQRLDGPLQIVPGSVPTATPTPTEGEK